VLLSREKAETGVRVSIGGDLHTPCICLKEEATEIAEAVSRGELGRQKKNFGKQEKLEVTCEFAKRCEEQDGQNTTPKD
jgi:hypothetical protein